MPRKPRPQITQGIFGVQARIQVADDDPSRNTATKDVEIFIRQAMLRFKQAAEAETYNRTEGLIDLQMVDGEGQWDSDIRSMRERKKRPCLTINRFIPMIAHVANEQRTSTPAIQINPVGNGADPDSAKVRQGMIRHIEYDSGAESVYDNAFDAMLEKGWSWFRVLSEYETETSFRQVLKIVGFDNDFCVYVDPSAVEPTRKDMKWAFIIEDIPIGEYAERFPNSQVAGLNGMFSSMGDEAAEWLTSQYVRVAEYYYFETEEAELIETADGEGRWRDELTQVDGVYFDNATQDVISIAVDEDGQPRTRKGQRKQVKYAIINAVEVLDGNDDKTGGRDWKGKWIPLIMVAGRQRNIRGQRRLAGMVRNNRDAQRMYNYWVTAFTEMIALAPKAPYTAAAGQIEKYKSIWDTANEENWPWMPYDPVAVGGLLVPAPSRNFGEPPVQAMIQAIRQADNDLKVGFNIFDAALGQKGPQESGKAILARKAESDSGNANWVDGMKKAIQRCGEILLDAMPHYYDSERVVTIVKPDNEREEVVINAEFKDEETGEQKYYDMATGRYSCTVTVGPADGTKRQEAVNAMLQLVTADPELFRSIGDLIVERMDWPGADVIVERLRKMLPPGLQDEKDQKAIMNALQGKLAALQAQHDLMTKALTAANQTIENKVLDIQSRERIEALKAEVQLAAISAKADAEAFKAQLKKIEVELAAFQRPGPVEGGAPTPTPAQPEPAAATA